MLYRPLLNFVIGILATWRIASILYREDIFHPVRNLLGIRRINTNDPPEYWIYPKNFVCALLSCFWCTSVWSGLFVLLLFLLPFHMYILLPLAFSSGAILFESMRNNNGE